MKDEQRLLEYYRTWLNDIQATASAEQEQAQDVFIIDTVEKLEDIGDLDEPNIGYSELKGPYGANMVMDGYSFDSVDHSCTIFITDFADTEYIQTLTKTDIDLLYNKMRFLVENSINRYITNPNNRFPQASPGYEFAELLLSREARSETVVSKFRFIIITNKMISNRVKDIKKDNIDGRKVSLDVWDIRRFFYSFISVQEKEEFDVDTSVSDGGIPCVKTVDCDDYVSYLAVVPGEFLAQTYLEYGARLLEGNVRSFLSARGKVNKAIRQTILKNPEMFFAYNNGISVTSTGVEVSELDGKMRITKIHDMQIINGGQTTASIANASLQDKADLSEIFVPMKLTMIKNKALSDEMVIAISRSANSQNKVTDADFFSNHPFHIRIEELSKTIYAPPMDGMTYQTTWFYERARGQYDQQQMGYTVSDKKKFQRIHPKNQLLRKVDIAKYINSYHQKPEIVSRGAQANMRIFAESISKEWPKDGDKSKEVFGEHYFKTMIVGLAILFRGTERLVSEQPWYQIERAFRANIVTYSIAILCKEIAEQCPGRQIDLMRLWNEQGLYPELKEQLIRTTRDVHNFITLDDRTTQNVTEWCKREECWKRAKNESFVLLDSFINTLKSIEPDGREGGKVNDNVEPTDVELIYRMGQDVWKKLWDYNEEHRFLTPMERGPLSLLVNMDWARYSFSDKNANIIMSAYRRLKEEGFED